MADVHPFDAAAPTYDQIFSYSKLGKALRQSVWREVEPLLEPGHRVLEIGCGTGLDAVWMAAHGCAVVATDPSPAMVDRTLWRARDGETYSVTAAPFDPNVSSELPSMGDFDGVFSNFGALNCVVDRPELFRRVAERMSPGGWFVGVFMGPTCPWEWASHIAKGRFRTAGRRFRHSVDAHVGNGETIRVWYPSGRRVGAELSPYFDEVYRVGVGVVLPPSYMDHWFARLGERRPKLARRLTRWDRRLGHTPWGRSLNDHYLICARRKETR